MKPLTLAGAFRLCALLVILAGAGFASRFQVILVVGESMRPSYAHGDLLIIDRNAYTHKLPERGEVVVAEAGGDLIVKRIVAMPRETVQVRRGNVYINGAVLPEPGVLKGDLSILPGTMGPERYALLGDNRALPPEQIVHAIVPKEKIIGKAVLEFRFRGG